MTLLFVKYDAMNNFVHEGHIKLSINTCCLSVTLLWGSNTLNLNFLYKNNVIESLHWYT